jgi:hypothetical protein
MLKYTPSVDGNVKVEFQEKSGQNFKSIKQHFLIG